MLGYAWQKGLVPISFEAIDRAIALNGAAITMNQQAFGWGRLAAEDLQAVKEAAGIVAPPSDVIALPLDDERLSRSLDERISRRVGFLTDYQNAAYAERYKALVERVRSAEEKAAPGSTVLSEAVARYGFKLMAYKDEYEVARLYTSGDFMRRVERTFEGKFSLHFHLAPPLLAKKNGEGHLIKAEYGSWVFKAFGLMAKLKGLRGTAFDVFGYTAERKIERQLIVDYGKTIDELLAGLRADNVALAAEIAAVPEGIRGFGHVKEAHLGEAMAKQTGLMQQWRAPVQAQAA
jgi:indolepyruvate ferredoxin oxidoreductase